MVNVLPWLFKSHLNNTHTCKSGARICKFDFRHLHTHQFMLNPKPCPFWISDDLTNIWSYMCCTAFITKYSHCDYITLQKYKFHIGTSSSSSSKSSSSLAHGKIRELHGKIQNLSQFAYFVKDEKKNKLSIFIKYSNDMNHA